MKIDQQGFSLIEMLIVVAIIGILAAIAIPSYEQYKIRANRADVQAEMLRIAQKMQNYYLIHHQYAGVNLTVAGYGAVAKFPKDIALAHYTLTLNLDDDGQGWQLIATPISVTQQGNGVVCLNDLMQKYWQKGQANCAMTATSVWDGR